MGVSRPPEQASCTGPHSQEAWAAAADDLRLAAWHSRNGLSLPHWDRIKVSAGLAPSEDRGEGPFLASCSFWWLPKSLGLWLHHWNLCLWSHGSCVT